MAIAIKDSANIDSKIFGKPSAGYTSILSGYTLNDETDLLLSTAYIKSENDTLYRDDSIKPDVPSKTPLEDALKWLNETSVD